MFLTDVSVCVMMKTCTSSCEQYSECAKCIQSGDEQRCNNACKRMRLVDTVHGNSTLLSDVVVGFLFSAYSLSFFFP